MSSAARFKTKGVSTILFPKTLLFLCFSVSWHSSSLPSEQPLLRVRLSVPGQLRQSLCPRQLPPPHTLCGGLRLRPGLRAQRPHLCPHAGVWVPGPSARIPQCEWGRQGPWTPALGGQCHPRAPRAKSGATYPLTPTIRVALVPPWIFWGSIQWRSILVVFHPGTF